jgi:hypothetical protein
MIDERRYRILLNGTASRSICPRALSIAVRDKSFAGDSRVAALE